VRTPILLWFSESIHTGTVSSTTVGGNPASVSLRVKDSLASISYDLESFCGDRLIALVPKGSLAPDMVYEVWLNQELTDLRGERYHAADSEVVMTFSTAATSTLQAPRVIGSFPPEGSTYQPNDHAVVVAFSSSIRPSTLSGAVSLFNIDSGLDADFNTLGVSSDFFADDRIVRFRHQNNATSDVDSQLSLSIETTLEGAGAGRQPLAEAFTANWHTLDMTPPVGFVDVVGGVVSPGSSAAPVHLATLSHYEVGVDWPLAFLPGDQVHLELHETFGQTYFAQESEPLGGYSIYAFDLQEPEFGTPLMNDGSLTLTAFAERDGRRTTVVAESTLLQDTQPPRFSYYGPPYFEGDFVTDLPELRPYGFGTEVLSAAAIEFDSLSETRNFLYDNSFFTGPAFVDPFAGGDFLAEGFNFSTTLTDVVGNTMTAAEPGYATFRGFVSGRSLSEAGNQLRVIAFDADTLQPIVEAQVDIDGLSTPEFTRSDGSVVFDGLTGEQTITLRCIDGAGVALYHPVSLLDVDASVVSVPMRSVSNQALTSFPVVLDPAGDFVIDGDMRVFTSLAVGENSGEVDFFGGKLQDIQLFGAYQVHVRTTRLGWWSGFYFNEGIIDSGDGRWSHFALDPTFLLGPTSSSLETAQFVLETPSERPLNPYEITVSGVTPADLSDPFLAATTVVPGLDGRAWLGFGNIEPKAHNDYVIRYEPILVSAAASLGAPAETCFVGLYADYNTSTGSSFWVQAEADLTTTPNTVSLSMPTDLNSITSLGATTATITGFDATTLASGQGWYRAKLEDLSNANLTLQWDIYLPSSSAQSGTITLPTAGGTAPLPDPGNWKVRLDAYGMPAGFDDQGFFFSSLRRDCLFWVGSDWN
ncbi:MAG: hypothetical protein HOM77_07030, partial [Planctomycetes bacterium]|nr:hypothetical protein [Planctomycetota bacterium]